MNDLIRIAYGEKGTHCYNFSRRGIAKAIKKYKSDDLSDGSGSRDRSIRLERIYKTLVFLAENKEQEMRLEDVSRHLNVSPQIMLAYLSQIRYDTGKS